MPQTKTQDEKQIKKLIKLNDALENYFHNTIIPQLFVDAELVLRKFTPPAMKQFNFTKSHIGKPMADLVDNIRFSTILEDIDEVIRTEEILEKEIQTTDGFWFQMNIIPYRIRKLKKLNGVIITFVDITGRIKNLRELEKLNASHETFIYSVSHDLRGPLNNIESLVENLIETSEEIKESGINNLKEQKLIGSMLNKSVKIMRNIVEELSEIAKIDGNYQEKTEKIDIETIVREVEMTIKERINETEAVLTCHIKAPEIEFSRKNLRSIIYNLMSNSLKHRSPKRTPVVSITTRQEKNFVVIAVKDNGLGISKEKQDEIFSKFTRLSGDSEGMGIGLYLIKKIVENAGGKIELKSTPGKGSEFLVYLKAN